MERVTLAHAINTHTTSGHFQKQTERNTEMTVSWNIWKRIKNKSYCADQRSFYYCLQYYIATALSMLMQSPKNFWSFARPRINLAWFSWFYWSDVCFVGRSSQTSDFCGDCQWNRNQQNLLIENVFLISENNSYKGMYTDFKTPF